MAGANGKDYFGKKLSPQESEAVVAELKKYLLGLADRWLFKGRFHTELEKRDSAHGGDPGVLAELVRLRGRDQ